LPHACVALVPDAVFADMDIAPLFLGISAENSWGQIIVQGCLYGYILCIGADMIGAGAELLMLCKKWAPLVGSIVVPILGAVPDGMMVLCSGLGDDAQEQIQIGVGALAGSTVMLLTLPWFLSVLTGRVTIKDGLPTYKQIKGQPKLQQIDGNLMTQVKYALFKTGVGIHEGVKVNARFMMMTTTPLWIMQVPTFFVDYPGSATSDREASALEFPCALSGVFGCFCFFGKYMHDSWQAAQEEGAPVNDKHIKLVAEAILNNNLNIRGVMHEFQHDFREEETSLKTGLLSGTTSQKTHNLVRHMCAILEPFFKNYDANGDDKISINEFRFLMRDLRENVSEDKTKAIFEAADMDKSGDINFEEFVACIMAFALDEKINDEDKDQVQQQDDEDEDEEGDEDGDEIEDLAPDLKPLGPEEQQRAIKHRAAAKMFFGSVLVCLFSDPMVDVLGAMGDKAHIPKFYVSFLFAPLASNASELVAAMKLAQKRTQSTMKESLSTLCGAAIMNNTFCLSLFFLCFVVKDLVWKFSAETISIVLIQFVIGTIANRKPTQTLFQGFVVLACYPCAMLVVYVLESPLIGLD